MEKLVITPNGHPSDDELLAALKIIVDSYGDKGETLYIFFSLNNMWAVIQIIADTKKGKGDEKVDVIFHDCSPEERALCIKKIEENSLTSSVNLLN